MPLLKLFARQPLPGKAKTRLAAGVGVDVAARVATGLIRETVELCVKAWPGEVCLEVWPGPGHPLFDRLVEQHKLRITTQVDGNLGDKMIAALHAGLDEGRPTALMGCDAPHCTPAQLKQAAQALVDGVNVFGRAEDGGFWLIGLNQRAPGLFDSIDWDAPDTGGHTLRGAQRIGLRFECALDTLFDIDTEAELRRLQQEFPELAARVVNTPLESAG